MKIVMENGSYFYFAKITKFSYDNNIHLSHSLDYFPKGNDQAESRNKNLINIINKLVSKN